MMPAPIQLDGPHIPRAVRRKRLALMGMGALLGTLPFVATAIAAYLRA
jgi:hypothetical protein